MRTTHILGITAAFAICATPVRAQVGMPYLPEQWHFELTPFLWAAGLDGTIAVGGQGTQVDASFGDVIKNVDFAFAAHFEASRNSLTLMAETFYVNLGSEAVLSDGTPAQVGTRQFMGEVAAGYRLGPAARSADFLAGVRYTNLSSDVETAAGPLASGDWDWFDPFVGIRLHVDLYERLPMTLRGDIGGFQIGGSDLSARLTVGLGYRLSQHVAIAVGWRVLDVEYDEGTGAEQFIYDVTQHGLIAAVTLGF